MTNKKLLSGRRRKRASHRLLPPPRAGGAPTGRGKRRASRWLTPALLLMIPLLACGTASPDRRSLLLAVNAGVEADGLKGAAKEYEKARGIAVEVIEYPYQSLFEKLLIALSSGSRSYDLVMIDDPWFPRFAEMGTLTELTPLYRKKGLEGPDTDFVAGSLALCRHPYDKGPLYALPYVGNTQLFFYRKDLFQKHGLPPPSTWSEVLETGRVIGQKERIYGYVVRGAQGNPVVVNFMPLLWAFGGEMFDSRGRVQIDRPAAVEALEFMLKLGELSPPGYTNFNADEVAAHLLQGTAVMAINWPAWIPAFKDPARSKVVGKVDFLTLPSQRRPGASAIGNWLLGIPVGSQKISEAFDFLLWATGSEQMRSSALRGNPPTRRSVFEDAELNKKFPSYPVQYEALRTARPRPRSPVWNEIENTLGIYLTQAHARYLTPAEALRTARRDIEEILSRWEATSSNP